MKKITRSLMLLAGLFLITTQVTAQKTLTKGKVVLEIVDVKADMDPAQLEQMKSIVGGTTTELVFIDDKQKVTINAMGGMVKSVVLREGDERTTMYMDAMGQKMKVVYEDEEQAKLNSQEKSLDEFEIQKNMDTRKEILGYDCFEVVLLPKEGEELPTGSSMIFYVTDKIKTSNDVIKGIRLDDSLGGFPLESSVMSEGLNFVIRVTEINGDVSKKDLEVDEKGYRILSPEEFSKQFGGMY